MVGINEIISSVQSEIGDINGTRIQHGEYRDMLNESMADLARETRTYYARYIARPTSLVGAWDATEVYNAESIVSFNGNYYVATLQNLNDQPDTGNGWTLIPTHNETNTYNSGSIVSFGTEPSFYKATQNVIANVAITNTDYWTKITAAGVLAHTVRIPATDANGNVLSPYLLLRVVRERDGNFTEMREYSIQSINSSISGNRPFPQNNYPLGQNAMATQTPDPVNGNAVNGSITLVFAQGFYSTDTVIIDFIQDQPFLMQKWLDTPIPRVPYWLKEPLFFGVLSKTLRRLYNKGDNKAQSRYYEAMKTYDRAKLEVAGYTRNFKDVRSAMQSFPHIWNPEHSTYGRDR